MKRDRTRDAHYVGRAEVILVIILSLIGLAYIVGEAIASVSGRVRKAIRGSRKRSV